MSKFTFKFLLADHILIHRCCTQIRRCFVTYVAWKSSRDEGEENVVIVECSSEYVTIGGFSALNGEARKSSSFV